MLRTPSSCTNLNPNPSPHPPRCREHGRRTSNPNSDLPRVCGMLGTWGCRGGHGGRSSRPSGGGQAYGLAESIESRDLEAGRRRLEFDCCRVPADIRRPPPMPMAIRTSRSDRSATTPPGWRKAWNPGTWRPGVADWSLIVAGCRLTFAAPPQLFRRFEGACPWPPGSRPQGLRHACTMQAAIADWVAEGGADDVNSAIEAWSLRRGGVQQQLRAAAAVGLQGPAGVGHDRGRSALAALLAEQQALGFLPAVLLQKIAAAAVQDGCEHPEVVEMSRLGACGEVPGNISRDLFKLHRLADRRLPMPLEVEVPYWDCKAKPPQTARHNRKYRASKQVGISTAHPSHAPDYEPRLPRLLAAPRPRTPCSLV